MTAPIGITSRTPAAPVDITEIVREKYGAAARRVFDINESASGCGPTSSCCGGTASGTLPRTTTSLTANRPPGFSTRNASASTLRLSPDRLITQFEIMTSTLFSGSGIASI